MEKRTCRYAVAALLASAAVFGASADPLVVFTFDQTLDQILRIQDLNDDGDTLDAGEVVVFTTDVPPSIGPENAQGLLALDASTLLATDNFVPDQVVLLRDLNGNGDAMDAGEQSVWWDGSLPPPYAPLTLTNPVTLSKGPASRPDSFALIDNNTLDTTRPEAIYILEDLNADGDVNDPGEVEVFFQLSPIGMSATTTFDVQFDNAGAAYTLDITDPNQIESIDRISPDGSAKTEYLNSATLFAITGYYISGMFKLSHIPETDEIVMGAAFGGAFLAHLLAVRDTNGSGNINVAGEVRLLWGEDDNADGVTSGSARDFFLLPDGRIVFCDAGQDQIVLLTDANGDGDYNDLGETRRIYTAAAAGGAGQPAAMNLLSITAIVEEAPACPGDLDGDGDVDTTDLNILLSAFGCTGGGCPGDADGDGDTDTTDLNILLSAFGATCA